MESLLGKLPCFAVPVLLASTSSAGLAGSHTGRVSPSYKADETTASNPGPRGPRSQRTLALASGALADEAVWESLFERKVNYHGQSVSKARDLVCSRVLPAWPKQGEACILQIEGFVSEELKDDLLLPCRCLAPKAQWPAVTPSASVKATEPNGTAWPKLAPRRASLKRRKKVKVSEEATGT